MLRTSIDEIGSYQITPEQYAEKFLPEEDRYIVREQVSKVLESTERNYSWQLEHRVIFGDGTRGHIAVRLSVKKNLENQLIKMTGVNQDITERKIVEEELSRQRYMINQLMENVPDLIYFKDTESKFLELSKSYYQRLNIHSSDKIIGKNRFRFFCFRTCKRCLQ